MYVNIPSAEGEAARIGEPRSATPPAPPARRIFLSRTAHHVSPFDGTTEEKLACGQRLTDEELVRLELSAVSRYDALAKDKSQSSTAAATATAAEAR